MNKDNLLLLLKDMTIRKEILNIVRPKLHTTKSISTKKILEIEPNGGAVNTNELAILRLVFKWKVLPVSIIKGCLRKNESMDTFRRRVNRLIERGLLKRVVYIGRLTLIQLTEYGFTRMKNGIDGFKEDGFSSEALWHDFLSAALQLGPLAPLKSKNLEIVTEQEMRRFFKRDLPSWLPDIDSHRPDGFSKFKFKDRNKILAYEVEISTKSPDRYDSVAQYYARQVQVNCVVWLVKNSAAVDTIQKSLRRYGPDSLNKHCFILLDDFVKKFWQALVHIDQETPCSLVQRLSDAGLEHVLTLSAPCPEGVVSDFLLELARGCNHYIKPPK